MRLGSEAAKEFSCEGMMWKLFALTRDETTEVFSILGLHLQSGSSYAEFGTYYAF